MCSHARCSDRMVCIAGTGILIYCWNACGARSRWMVFGEGAGILRSTSTLVSWDTCAFTRGKWSWHFLRISVSYLLRSLRNRRQHLAYIFPFSSSGSSPRTITTFSNMDLLVTLMECLGLYDSGQGRKDIWSVALDELSFDLVCGLLPFDLLVKYLFVFFFVADLWCWSIGDLNSNFQLHSCTYPLIWLYESFSDKSRAFSVKWN